MRVLTIAKDFPSAGQPEAGIFVLRQARALAEMGHEIFVARVVPHAPAWTPKWRAYRSIPKRDIVEGIPVETIRALVPPRMIGFEFLPFQVDSAIRRIVAEFQPDVVHGHFLLPSGQLAVRQLLPSIVTAHGSDAYDWAWRRHGLRRAATEAIRRADIVVAVSDFIAQRVRALFDRDVEVVYNAADDGVFRPLDRAAARRELRIAADRFVVAFAGRPSRAKGAFDLVEAAARMRDERPLLLMAGDGEETPALQQCIATSGADVRLLGTLDHAALARVFAAADVFALPSYREGLPVSVCEAMLAGRPIVATPVGGIPEIVRDGSSGLLTAPGDVGSLARALRALAREPARVQSMGAAARRFASQHLTWRVNAQRYDELYRRAA